MNIPDSGSVVWIFIRQVVIGALMLGFALFAYKNSMSTTDIVSILITMGTVFGLDVFKRVKAPNP